MGAWGLGSFENDDAQDWISRLEQSQDDTLLIAAFDAVNSATYRESPECTTALAAAEVVAALNKKPGSDLPDAVKVWVSNFEGPLSESVKAKASEAVDHVLVDSELQELWAETDEFQEWKVLLVDLLIRLK